MSDTPEITDDYLRRCGVDLLLATRNLLRARGVTGGSSPEIKSVDLWPRMESGMVNAAATSRNMQEFTTALLQRLGRTTPTRVWSVLIESLSRGETVTDAGEAVTAPQMALNLPGNWRRFKDLIRRESTYLIVMAQVESEQRPATLEETPDAD